MDKQPTLEDLSYRELQELCKENDLKASGRTEELIQRLKDHAEPKEEKEDKSLEGKSEARVMEGEKVRRVYTRKIHGGSFIEKARTYIETRPGENLEVEVS